MLRWVMTSWIAAVSLACGAKVGDDGAGTEGDGTGDGTGDATGDATGDTTTGGSSGSAGTTSTSTESTTAVDGGPCDPSDSDVGPSVSISILNNTAAPLYFTQTLQCSIGVPYAIERDGMIVPWLIEDCVTCQAIIAGACGCPGACAADSVLRVDAGGRWDAAWLGYEAVPTQLGPDCANASCGDQCTARQQSPDGDYTLRAIASVDVACGGPGCDCLGPVDPAGWCSVSGVVAGEMREASVTIAYPDETTVELAFE